MPKPSITLPNRPLRVLSRLALVGLIATNILVTTFLTIISRANYLGGAALALLNTHNHHPTAHVHVHIDNLAAQTGASLFTQEHSPPYFFLHEEPLGNSTSWTYSKDPAPESFDSFTYLITEHPESYNQTKWDVIDNIKALERVDIRRGLNALVMKPTLFILKNKDSLY